MSSYKGVKILLLEDEQKIREILAEEIQSLGVDVEVASCLEQAKEKVRQFQYEIIITDLRLPDGLGFELLEMKDLLDYRPDFIVITAFGTIEQAVSALKKGASDFITKPLDLEHFSSILKKTIERREIESEVQFLRKFYKEKSFHGIVGKSRSMMQLYSQISTVAMADGPVLIMGESGTGKELVAKSIHLEGPNSKGPYIAVNCASIPSDLFESEFFGHKQGAFTGAHSNKVGVIEQAQGGTLFLDEITEMPHDLQAKLLRFLQEKKIRPVGGQEKFVNVRVVAATNRDILKEVEKGHFREDLYYRLETFSLYIPSLRERKEDIEVLLPYFLEIFSNRLTAQRVVSLDADALRLLKNYDFPGNVRELKSVIERAVTFCHGDVLTVQDFPSKISQRSNKAATTDEATGKQVFSYALEEIVPLEEIERAYIGHVLDRVDGNKRRAAHLLGIGRRTLYRRLEDSDD